MKHFRKLFLWAGLTLSTFTLKSVFIFLFDEDLLNLIGGCVCLGHYWSPPTLLWCSVTTTVKKVKKTQKVTFPLNKTAVYA